ncbi:hypothetical protein Pmar_PMAR013057 [Perkinsus marinus ATCC 50983]|uniref:Uncharacterized protein n=1 Tax=Perkinsus marinus (strain ATCC 50983 / TXsc) TaxID=423536 RepID=C5KUR0_PERM5|nr:hypothetical protein Pmar_PMAR013057 [Perkinsus marinus ATCC 50983]EER11781.1 hypothetical protein Pmar_PMAR013057 [Perkinsus marinus ATCC 50983]|eukprot:XP_002779986.1 hypothetical protein Pmar_PMAR013057 [Perkinsus marinus ATCC 50983]
MAGTRLKSKPGFMLLMNEMLIPQRAERRRLISVELLHEIDKLNDSNAKPKRILRALRRRGLLKGIKNTLKCINSRLYQTLNRSNASNSRPRITAYCNEKSTIPDCMCPPSKQWPVGDDLTASVDGHNLATDADDDDLAAKLE